MAMDGGLFPLKGENRRPLWPSDPLLLGVVIFFACLFGIYTRPVGFLATLWPANAIMLGFLLRRPGAARASGWLFAAAAYLAADLLTGADLAKAVLLNLANIIGVGTAYIVCSRLPADAIRLRQPSSMLYVALAAAAGACAAGIAGSIANPILFGDRPMTAGLQWFATEFINYIAILPVILSWPASGKLSFPFGKAVADDAGSARPSPLYAALPVLALVLSCVTALLVGGPGAVAFPVPALLWCGLTYAVFPTAVLGLLFGCGSLIAISAGYFSNAMGAPDAMPLVAIRLGASLITLAPVTLATVMQSRTELIDLLQRSRRRLDLALDAGGIVGTWALDIPSVKVNLNASLADLLGLQLEQARPGLKDMLSASVHPADQERTVSALKDAIARRSDYQSRFRIVTQHGEIRWLMASGRPVRGQQGSAERLAGIVIDVTEHAETEAALHQSNLRFHIVTEAIPQIVWSTDADGRHDYFNHRWTEFTGVAVEATDPETWKTLVHADDWPAVAIAWRGSLATGKTYDVDYRMRYHDGTYRWLKVLAKPLRDTDGNITRWYGTSTDIDAAKHFELERELVAHELDHRIKNLFALVNSLVGFSVREAPALRALAEPLSARLNALHQAHSLISGRPDAGTSTLQELLQQLLRPYDEPGSGKIAIGGIDRTIDTGAFRSMALLLHELITNSAKYGALSQNEGRLHLALAAEGERLTITWTERFSGKSHAEDTSGFGSRLMRTIVEIQLRGSLTHSFVQDGLTVIIDLPQSAIDGSEQLNPEPVDRPS
jgi:PAS domain S-box-containing protein